MPKSTHRRNGKPRPRRTGGNTPAGPLFTYRGQRFRGVARLPDGNDLHALEARHGDDPATITLALLRAALGDNAVEQIINDSSSDSSDHTDDNRTADGRIVHLGSNSSGGDTDATPTPDATLNPNNSNAASDMSADGTLDVGAIVPLVDQICAHYFGDMLRSYVTQRLPGGGGAGA